MDVYHLVNSSFKLLKYLGFFLKNKDVPTAPLLSAFPCVHRNELRQATSCVPVIVCPVASRVWALALVPLLPAPSSPEPPGALAASQGHGFAMTW